MFNPHYGFVDKVPLRGTYHLMNLNNSVGGRIENLPDNLAFDVDVMMFITNDGYQFK